MQPGYSESSWRRKNRPAVITTTFDGRLPWLKDLIEAVFTFTPLPLDLIVVDNGTTDGTRQFLTGLEWVRTLHNAANLDDTLGTNQALQIAQTDYIVKIDTDTLIAESGWWEAVYSFMEANPRIGIAGDVWLPGYFLSSQLYRAGWPDPALDLGKLPHVQGGFMVLRRQMLDQIGFFNEQYPHIGMDIEISHRALSYGWELGQLPFVISRRLPEPKIIPGYKVYHPVVDPVLRQEIMQQVTRALPVGSPFIKNVRTPQEPAASETLPVGQVEHGND